ncbi:MAG: hypothetical protein K6C08_02070 [Oscillospiraceae bacterium]|nr:hypothetical protein [Oscillospiraceae bacterium]
MKENHNLLDLLDTDLTEEQKNAAADPIQLGEDDCLGACDGRRHSAEE